jgi:hypothetical protein
MKKLAILVIALAGFAVLGASQASAAGMSGAIFTTDVSCVGTNVNQFAAKDDVYLDGGPHHTGSAGLPDGTYYVQVTEPNGTQLGTSVPNQPVNVINGSFETCYQLSAIVTKTSDSTPGFDTTSNGGGVYKVWVCNSSDFSHQDGCKTDNFKIKENPVPAVGNITGMKYEDLNANGVNDPGEPGLADWTIQLYDPSGSTLLNSTTTDAFGFYSFDSLPTGPYKVCEVIPDGWFPSAPTTSTPNCHNVTVNAHHTELSVDFGNYRKASLAGMKFNDLAGDGIKDVTDPGLAGWSIVISGPDGSTQVTDVNGAYSATVTPGTYTVCETMQPGWMQTFPATGFDCGSGMFGYQVTVVSGDATQNALDFGNRQLGKIVVQKVTVPSGDPQSFNFSLTGPNSFSETFSLTDGQHHDSAFVVPGSSYMVSETVPSNWIQTGAVCDNGTVDAVVVTAGGTTTCTFTNTKKATIIVIKHVINDNGGTKVASDFTMNVTATNPSLTSFPGAEAPGTTVTVDPGAYSVDETADSGYKKTLGANCSGTVVAAQTVTCTITNDDIPVTRTQGFWSTHTSFTNAIFALAGMQKFVGATPHKGPITNTLSSKASQLYGAFFAGISKKSNGKARLMIDQDRMILLQQLVAAKLNCAAFICNSATLTMIANADSAYAGSSASAILTAAGQMGAYNSSGDSQPFPTGLPPIGTGTPKTSQGYANIIFWDAP